MLRGAVIICSFLVLGFTTKSTNSLQLRAYLSEHGIHGTITFSQPTPSSPLTITTSLATTLEYPSHIWSLSIVTFPVDYRRIENRCRLDQLGDTLHSLDDTFGYLILPDNNTVTYTYEAEEDSDRVITSVNSLYGRSVMLSNLENPDRVTCASLSLVEKDVEKVAVAHFKAPIAGQVFFRWFYTQGGEKEMLVMPELYHTADVEGLNLTMNRKGFTEHHWKIYVTDILDADNDKSETDCNILQLVFDAENRGDNKAMGDVDERLGKVRIATKYGRGGVFKSVLRDEVLSLLPGDLTGPQRRLYLVVFGSKHEDTFLACAKIRYEQPVTARSLIQSGGIKGDVTLTQHNRFEPTFLNFNLTTARGDVETKLVYSSSVAGYKIHDLPMTPAKTVGQTGNTCLTTKFVYNPRSVDLNVSPPNGLGTQDQYAIGDLSGKLFGRNNITELIAGSQELSGSYWDIFLPLQGQFSIVHRSLIIYKNTQYTKSAPLTTEPWICGDLNPYETHPADPTTGAPSYLTQKQLLTAQVVFRYPLVGRILLRQPRDEPWADTTMLVEYLVHADGAALNNSFGHRWAVHEEPPGADFYNWSMRCMSAGKIFNPYKIDFNNKTTEDECSMESVGNCRMGDLSTRHTTLSVAGRIAEADRISRTLLTDTFLPLSGYHRVIGKSFLMYDDHGPEARGERLACSIIGGVYRRKAVVRDWFPNDDVLTVKGKIEFYQQTEYDVTNVEVDLQGLIDSSGYHVHITPVEESLEFPCEGTSLYDHWNPLNVDPSSSPRGYLGTPDQYEMGDLSGKFGTLDNHTIYVAQYNDTMLPLFGPRSILGRSVIIHKKSKNRRWACSTIERGYSPSEARELRAIVSFHNPNGFAYGYMRMRQLVYNDGSSSDTIIEIKLRHPGQHDRNITRDHNWAVFVNPVGVDATVKTTNTRCVAGGYVWNPYYTQLADPLNGDLYRQECGPENPLRCHVGDLSSRLGTIDIGLRRFVYTDSNLPLEGTVTAMGRSVVIKGPNKQPESYACANIEPDHDIIKYANIERPPRFVLAQFIEDVRHVMGIPEWMLTVDSRKTKRLHGNSCIQFLMHFKGPIAERLEKDFSKLLATGRLEAPSLTIPGYFDEKRKAKISYKQCGMRDPNEKEKKRKGRFDFITGTASRSTTSCVYLSIITFISYYFIT